MENGYSKLLTTFLFYLVCFPTMAQIVIVDHFDFETSHLTSRGLLDRQLCFSDRDRGTKRSPVIGEDENVFQYFIYKTASGCKNGTPFDNSFFTRNIPDIEFKTEAGDGEPGDGDSIKTYFLYESNHGNDASFVASQQTSAGQSLLRVTAWESPNDDYVSAATLEATSLAGVFSALDWIYANRQSTGIRVVNFSLSLGYYYIDQYCDNRSLTPSQVAIKTSIQRLVNAGIIFVAAGGSNPSTSPSLAEFSVTAFPACLSFVYAAGKYSFQNGKKYYRGARGPGLSFVDGSVYTLLDGGTDTSTSMGAGELSGQIAELLLINPNATPTRIRNELFATADNTGRIYYPNTNDTKYDTNRKEVNFARAKSAIIDPVWKSQIRLQLAELNDMGFGWNYGSNEHNNGLLTYFAPITTLQNQNRTHLSNILSSQSASSTLQLGDPTLRYSFRPYDIDTVGEVEFLINDQSYGFLETTSSGQLGATQTFCIDPNDLTSDGTNNEVKLRLTPSGETWGVTDLKIEIGTVDETCTIAEDPYEPLPDNENRIFGISDPMGNAYGEEATTEVPVDITFEYSNSHIPTPSNFDTNRVRRDLRIKFIAKGGSANTTDNGTIVRINGRNEINTPYIFGDEQEYEFILNRSNFQVGLNQIRFRPRDTSTGAIWGIRNISIEYIEPIELSVDTTDTNVYGYNETPTRFSGLRVNFDLPPITNDYGLSLKGWDIDSSTENQVFINGQSLGYLDTSPNLNYNSGETILLPKSSLNEGFNQIEFVQKRPGGDFIGGTSEQWAVKDLGISLLAPDLFPLIFTLEEDAKIRRDRPFNVVTVIKNGGEGSANASTLNYYLSTDDAISTADTLLETRPLQSLEPDESISITNEVQTPLVNKDYFLGVCIIAVINESNTSNNCSDGIELTSDAVIAPILFLLLDEDE